MDYTQLKELIEQYSGLGRDALHIHMALFIYILAALLFRRSRRSLVPWLVVFAVALANEAHDQWLNWPGGAALAIGESVKDLWNTMLWPTVLMLIGRHTGWSLWPARPPQPGEGPADRGEADPEPARHPAPQQG